MAKRSNNPLRNFSLLSSLKSCTNHRSSNSDEDSTATLPNSSSLPPLFLKWGTQRKVGCTRRSSASNSSGNDSTATTWNNPLHNFSSLPSFLNWGTQCTAAGGRTSASNSDEVLRQKLKSEAKDAILRKEEEEAVRPWNLRKRRAKVLKIDEMERVKNFSLQLSKKEIEEDFFAILGHRPPRRLNKRPKLVQKHFDMLFPAFCLTELTSDSYKVPGPNLKGKNAAKCFQGSLNLIGLKLYANLLPRFLCHDEQQSMPRRVES